MCAAADTCPTVQLPETADLQKTEVKMEHGQLKMCIPKREHPTGRKLQIQ